MKNLFKLIMKRVKALGLGARRVKFNPVRVSELDKYIISLIERANKISMSELESELENL